MLYHGQVSWAKGGFLGVDVFFVLSGFLITSLLLGEIGGTGRLDLPAFWRRRARRLLPALIVLLAAVAIYARIAAAPSELNGLRSDAFASLAYVSNWKFIFDGRSYFQAFQAPSPLAHTWSLAIEEQWYLVWPLALLGLLRVCRRRRGVVFTVVAALALASAATAAVLYHAGTDPSRVYYGTDTRAQTLLVGALLAIATAGREPWLALDPRRHDRATFLLGCAGALALALMCVGASSNGAFLYRGGFLLVAVCAAAVVAAASGNNPLARALSIRPLRAIGVISYGLYLWHWPVDVVANSARTGLSGAALFFAQSAISVTIATVSYVLVERPIRHHGLAGVRLPRLRRPGVVIVPAALASVVALVFVSTTGAVAEPSVSALERAQARLAARVTPHRDAKRVLLVGDSQLLTLGFFAGNTFAPTSDLQYRMDPIIGCGALGPGMQAGDACATRVAKWTNDVASFDPDLSVVMLGAWETLDFTVDGHRYAHGTLAHEQELISVIGDSLHVLTARGGKVALLEVPCYGEPESTDIAQQDVRTQPSAGANVNAALAEIARRDPAHVTFVRWADAICPGGQFTAKINGVRVRPDGVHFANVQGVKLVTDRLVPQFRALARRAHAQS
jgi:peptidoglycan/LPS O-acetylase OafA/YrhL